MHSGGALSLQGETLVLQFKNEARVEHLLARCADDDLPLVPEVDVLASAQSRRAVKDSSK